MRASPAAKQAALICLSRGDKVCPATTVDPDRSIIIAPGLPLDTGRTTTLIRQAYPTAGIRRAVVAFAIIRRAGDSYTAAPVRRRSTRSAGPISTAQEEVRPATAVNPNPCAGVAPGLPLDAGRAAALVNHLYPSPGIHAAQMPLSVIGSTGDVGPVLRSNPALPTGSG